LVNAVLDALTIEQAQRLTGAAPMVVALSGGGDSTALLELLSEQLGAARLLALVVDHGLRAGSDVDAARARGFAEALGVRAEVLSVVWPQGAKRAQAHARAARYELLCVRARQNGARVIALAHTADDQIETVFMRARAQSSWRGLAGMSPLTPAPVWPQGRGLWIARPLLGARRARLRGYLQARGRLWIEDPANANCAYERVRVRARLTALDAAGAGTMSMANLAARLRGFVDCLDGEAQRLVERAARFDDEAISIDPGAWTGAVHARRRALSVLFAAAAGAPREPAFAALARLEARLGEPTFAGACLGGARLARTRKRLRIDRDPGALVGRAGGATALAPLPLEPGQEAVWDGRLALCVDEPGWSVVAAAGAPELVRLGQRRALANLVAIGQARWLLSQRVNHLLGRID
jgi:tRNA(Ile)-lysidine synthase